MPSTLWIDTIMNEDVANGGEALLSLMTGVSVTQTRGDVMTLLRTIVRMDIGAVVHDQGEGDGIVHVGIGVASQEAFAAATVPDPEINTDFPQRGWVWRSNYRFQSFAADQAAVDRREIDLDIRARRKLENGEAYIVIHNISSAGTPSAKVSGIIRQLWLIA